MKELDEALLHEYAQIAHDEIVADEKYSSNKASTLNYIRARE